MIYYLSFFYIGDVTDMIMTENNYEKKSILKIYNHYVWKHIKKSESPLIAQHSPQDNISITWGKKRGFVLSRVHPDEYRDMINFLQKNLLLPNAI